MAAIHEAIKGMEDTIITEKVAIGINQVEIGEMTEVRVTVGLDQVLGQVQIETELDALSTESTIILHENGQ